MAANATEPTILINLTGGATAPAIESDSTTFNLLTMTQALGAFDTVVDEETVTQVTTITDDESGETSDDTLVVPMTMVSRTPQGLTVNDGPTVMEFTEYGSFEDAIVEQLYQDLCTAVSQQSLAGAYWGTAMEDPDSAAEACPRAFAHYAATAIAGFINSLDITIELQADTSAAMTTTTISALVTAGSATTQSMTTAAATTDIAAAIEASTFKVTIATKPSPLSEP